jgi:hypothetical protein
MLTICSAGCNKVRSRCNPQPLPARPVMIGDLIREGKLGGPLQLVLAGAASLFQSRNSCACPRACRCRRFLGISSGASAVPGIARPLTRSGRDQMHRSPVLRTVRTKAKARRYGAAWGEPPPHRRLGDGPMRAARWGIGLQRNFFWPTSTALTPTPSSSR